MQLVPSHLLILEFSFPDDNVTRSGRIGFIRGVWLPLVIIEIRNRMRIVIELSAVSGVLEIEQYYIASQDSGAGDSYTAKKERLF